jgi:hypothetical protein
VPQGFLAIKAPDGIDPKLFGQNVAVATTNTGAPIVAFAVHDAQGDRSTIQVATYDGVKKAFGKPVTVASGSLFDAKQSISIALDAASGTELLTWDDGGKIIASQTSDDGATWHTTTVADGSDLLHTGRTPAIAASRGKVAIVYTDGNDLPAVATGELSGTTFTVTEVPNTAAPLPTDVAPAVAAAPDGTFGVAYIVSPDAGGKAAAYLPVGGTTPVVAIDSNGVQNDSPSVSLAFTSKGPLVGATICRVSNEDDACTFVATSTDGGATFGAPVAVPPDTGTGGGFATRVATDSKDHGAFAYISNSGSGSNKSGQPKLAVSNDLKTWQTCSPDQNGSLGLESGVPSLGVGPDDSLVIAFQQTSTFAKAPVGVLVVLYPPLGSQAAKP